VSEHSVSHEDLMRYLDGELPPDARARIATHIEGCTECNREYVVFEAMKNGFRSMLAGNGVGPSLWASVSRRLVQPTAWLLIVAGAAGWVAWGLYAWFISPEHFLLKITEGFVVLGLALLLAIAVGDRLRDLKTDPYREIQR
jgi:anti-sigma factor RsiW